MIAQLSVARHGDLLIVPVSIRGEQYPFILDTGSMANAIHASLADRLSPLKRSSRRYPEGSPSLYELPAATISGTELSVTGDAAQFDLDQVSRMSGHQIQGILGMGFLDGRIIDFDFDAGTVTFLKSVDRQKSAGIPVRRDSVRRPTISIELDSETRRDFIIDTGMLAPGIGEVTPSLFRALQDNGRLVLTGPPPRVTTVAGQVVSKKGRLDVFRLADFEHHGLRLTSGPVNALGLRYLSRFHMTLDLVNDQVYFRPGKRFDASPVYDASGMIVTRAGGKTVVEKIHPDGPAAAADIRVGDVITLIDKNPVDDESLFELRQFLSRPTRIVTISIARANQELERRLELRHWQTNSRLPSLDRD